MHIKQSNGDADIRSDEELATDLDISKVVLMSLKHTTPQQSALNLFNYFYPGYVKKTNLDTVHNLEILKPGLLDNMLGKYIFFVI